jgi:hypothetical protein
MKERNLSLSFMRRTTQNQKEICFEIWRDAFSFQKTKRNCLPNCLKERQKKNLTKSQRVHDNVRRANLILLITTGSRILNSSPLREPPVMCFEKKEKAPKNRRFLLFQEPQKLNGFSERTSKEPVVLWAVISVVR